MSTFMKLMLVPALVIAFSVGVALAASTGGDDQLAQVAPATATVEDSTTTTTTDATTTTTGGVDISGPCDEAENANDPRCTGTGGAAADDRRDDDREPGEDLRGPCDEAEHANDPRCTGAANDGRHGNSGPGNAEDRDDDSSGHRRRGRR